MMTETTHHERYDPRRAHRLEALAFLFGFAESVFVYILSSYFEQAIGTSNVSLFYLVAFSLVLAGLVILHPIVRRFGVSTVLLSLIVGIITLQSILSLSPISLGGSGLVVLYLAATTLGWTLLDIALERYSDDRRSGRIRGLFLLASSLGYLLGPILSTSLLGYSGFHGVFTAGIILYALLLIAGLLALWGVNPRPGDATRPITAFRAAWRRTDIRRIWTISFAMEFFYAVMIVYTSLRLRELGMSWNDIGTVIAVALLAFPLVQYPLGFLADKRFGEKELLLGSLVIAGSATTATIFIETSDVLLWSIVLFLTRVGIAGVEVLRDSYFYKRIDGDDGAMIAFFRTARPAGNILAAGATGFWLLSLPLSSIFLLPAVILFAAIVPAWNLEDNQSEREKRASP